MIEMAFGALILCIGILIGAALTSNNDNKEK